MRVFRLVAAALIAWCAFAISNTASATTYYVRTDGGNARQCTGRADAAYPGTGSSRACAWNHPFVALPPLSDTSNPTPPRIRGGDTLVIGPGDYEMGAGARDASVLYPACGENYPWDCWLAPIPSGLATQPTRIVGKGWDSGCKTPPQLWGSQRSHYVLDLDGSSHVFIACINVTDHSGCIEFDSDPNVACIRDRAPYGDWASIGLHAQDSGFVALQDLRIHGMAHSGIQAGRLHDWILERVKLIANGWVGWDGDLGSGSSSNAGNITFDHAEVAWNGCAEQYPGMSIYACWGQQENGYGDGLGTAATGGDWTINESYFHNNTQDGLDLLYANGSGRVTIGHSRFEGNAGNQVKVSGPSVIRNSVIIGSCASFNGKYDMTSGDNCRALGDALVLAMTPGSLASVSFNTITGQGNCLAIALNGNRRSQVDLYHNVMLGQPHWGNTFEQSCLFYWDKQPSGSSVVIKNNTIWKARHDSCPPGNICRDPMLKPETLEGFDPK